MCIEVGSRRTDRLDPMRAARRAAPLASRVSLSVWPHAGFVSAWEDSGRAASEQDSRSHSQPLSKYSGSQVSKQTARFRYLFPRRLRTLSLPPFHDTHEFYPCSLVFRFRGTVRRQLTYPHDSTL